ncbi:MAG: CGNR zinc finger domain-containing protein [Gemmatimonadaceae bacterium]
MPDPVQERFAPDAPFRFVGGDPSLDFVNTADWTPRGLERDRFTDYDRLVEWARGAGLVGTAEARRMGQSAVRHPRRADAAVDAARDMREILRDVFMSLVAKRHSTTALERLNTSLAAVAPHTRVVRDAEGQLVRGWAGLGDSADSLLWPVVWAAADLIASSDADKLRLCAGQDCGWLYVDRSRNGLRRWCEMRVCGTAEKNRRRAAR